MPGTCRRTRPLIAVLTCAAALAAPAAALAGNPLTSVPGSTSPTPGVTTPTTTATVTTATATTASSSGGGLNTIELVGIGVVVLVVFASIAWVIHGDARAHAPSRTQMVDINRERATVRPRAERVKSSRAKAKAARRARRAKR